MTTKKWRLVVTPLGATTHLHEVEVDAPNWMGALKSGRLQLGEAGAVPAGASCATAPDGTVTLLDPGSRRRFVLTATSAAAAPAQAPASQPAPQTPTTAKKRKFQTVAYTPEQARAAVPAAKVTPAKTERAATPADVAAKTAGEPAAAREAAALRLLLARDEEPSPSNPLSYRERAYYVPKSMSVSEAESALRFILTDLRKQLAAAPRGKFVNLAGFDHEWAEQPARPPLVVLEWRDWRGEPSVDYPATERDSSPATEADLADDERLDAVFDALHELPHQRTPAMALDFVVQLLSRTVPCAAISACLYDINTDELRFVAVTGQGAEGRQGKAVPRSAGLFGQAARSEHAALVLQQASLQPGYDEAVDGRAGLAAETMLYRAVAKDADLLAVLQLINREGGEFTTSDAHLVSYISDSLAEFLYEARARVHR